MYNESGCAQQSDRDNNSGCAHQSDHFDDDDDYNPAPSDFDHNQESSSKKVSQDIAKNRT